MHFLVDFRRYLQDFSIKVTNTCDTAESNRKYVAW